MFKEILTKGIFLLSLSIFLLSCKEDKSVTKKSSENSLEKPVKVIPEKKVETPVLVNKPDNLVAPKGMVWIPGGSFEQGAVTQDRMAMDHEKPAIPVEVDGFFIDITEVTNTEFARFVKETNYTTVAERAIDWEDMKKQLPADAEKPHDSILQPGSLTFKKAKTSVPNLYDFSQWWKWTIGANWKHPNGPESSIVGKDNYPVVQVSYEDALAYCEWSGRRLPTEAEWELASRAGNYGTTFFWGDDATKLSQQANTWEGEFPVMNTMKDGYELRAPVKSYPPNDYGVYDMAGNVWEWTSDWYNTNYYKEMSSQKVILRNPNGSTSPYTPNNSYAQEKVIKGGSFLCSESYCASYRVSARMGSSMDSSLEHTGFRTVVSVDMLQ